MTSPRTGQTNRNCTIERWVSPTLTVRVTGPESYQEDFTIAANSNWCRETGQEMNGNRVARRAS